MAINGLCRKQSISSQLWTSRPSRSNVYTRSFFIKIPILSTKTITQEIGVGVRPCQYPVLISRGQARQAKRCWKELGKNHLRHVHTHFYFRLVRTDPLNKRKGELDKETTETLWGGDTRRKPFCIWHVGSFCFVAEESS